jgi:hypothetical protein
LGKWEHFYGSLDAKNVLSMLEAWGLLVLDGIINSTIKKKHSSTRAGTSQRQ